MSKAADLAIAFCSCGKIEVGESVGLGRSRCDARVFQEVFANQVRQSARGFTDTDVGAGLTKVDREQLRMAIGEMQQADVAETRWVVQCLCNLGTGGVERHTAGGRSRQRPEKFSPVH